MITLQPSGPTSGSVERVLRASKMFQGLGPALLGELASGSVRKRIGRGEALWREGDPATRFVLISAGLVKIVQRAADQTDCIIGFFGPREAVGTVAVLKKGRYPASAIASSDHVEYLSLEPKPLIAAMDTDPAAARAMSGALIHHTGALHEKIAVMSAGAVPQRLATQLLTLAERFGDELDDGTLSIPLVLSRGEMACLVGARVETTIRVLTSWQKRGVVELGRDGARILAPEELRAIARGAKTAAGAPGDDDALASPSTRRCGKGLETRGRQRHASLRAGGSRIGGHRQRCAAVARCAPSRRGRCDPRETPRVRDRRRHVEDGSAVVRLCSRRWHGRRPAQKLRRHGPCSWRPRNGTHPLAGPRFVGIPGTRGRRPPADRAHRSANCAPTPEPRRCPVSRG